MRKFFNTLYITTQETYLSKERETVAVHLKDDMKKRFPFHNLDGIVCFGNIRISPYLIGACGEKGISISYLTEHGQFLGRFTGPVSGNVLLRRQQYRFADSVERRIDIARNIVMGKVYNHIQVLKRFLRDNQENKNCDVISSIVTSLNQALKRLEKTELLDSIRGIEGESAALYFSVFDYLILHQKESIKFNGRNRRPPLDPVNALLSFLYTLVLHDITSACETVGLDPSVGYLHTDRPGRNSLALDLMEEFRAFLADRIALSLINRKQITSNDFSTHLSGAVILSQKGKKTLLETYQKRKAEEIFHPFLQEKMPIGVLFFYQALLLCRYIRGDIDAYPPFFWR